MIDSIWIDAFLPLSVISFRVVFLIDREEMITLVLMTVLLLLLLLVMSKVILVVGLGCILGRGRKVVGL